MKAEGLRIKKEGERGEKVRRENRLVNKSVVFFIYLFAFAFSLYSSFDFYPWERVNYPQPVQISKFKTTLIETSFTDFFSNMGISLNRLNLIYVQPFEFMNLGVNYNLLSFNDLYKEEVYDLTFSKEFRKIIFGVSFDKTEKMFFDSLSSYSDSNMCLNLGVRLKVKYGFYPGIFFKDIFSNEKEGFGLEGAYIGDVLNGRVLFLIDKYNNWSVDSIFEKWFFKNNFSVKAGISFGSKNYRLILLSFSYIHLKQFLLEYDFYFPFSGVKNTYGTHLIKFSFYFNKVKKEELRVVSAEKPNYYFEAKYYIEKDNLLDAWNELKKGLREKPDDYRLKELLIKVRDELFERAESLKNKGDKFLEGGKYLKAFGFYDRAVKVFPDYDEAVKNRNILKKVLEYFKEVRLPLLRKAINFYISNRARDSLLILTYLSQIYKDKNIEKFKKYVERKTDKKFDVIKGMNIIESKLVKALNDIYDGRYDRAILECRDILIIDSKNILALKRMGSALYALGRRKEAEKYWKEALKINPDDNEIKDFLSSKTQNKKNNILDLKKIYMRGLSFLAKKEFEKAKEKFKIIVNSNTAPLDLKKKAEKKYSEADRLYSEKIKLMKLYFGQGLYYYKKGDYKKAIKQFKKILELEPDHAQSKRLIDKCRKNLKN